MPAGYYGKARSSEPTDHLFIANCGPAVGIPVEAIQQLLTSLGAQQITFSSDGRPIIYVDFRCEQQSSQALKVLTSTEITAQYKRSFVVKYADFTPRKDAFEECQKVYLSTENCGVPGLALYLDYVTPKEEQDLLAALDDDAWETLANRRVQHYGFRFEYKTRNIDCSQPIQPFPAAAASIVARMRNLKDMPAIDQLTVNEYPPGVGLAPHIDTHSAFTGAIASLSLNAGCVMEMRLGADRRAIYLAPRSLLVMAGPARYQWQHYIPHRKSDMVEGVRFPRADRRVSFTFRKVRGFPCDCPFLEHCDSQNSKLPITRLQQLELDEQHKHGKTAGIAVPQHEPSRCMLEVPSSDCSAATLGCNISPAAPDCRQLGGDVDNPKAGTADADVRLAAADAEMESRHVHAVYEIIASHFSATRFAVWPKVRNFLEGLPRDGVLADVGCGNGKYFAVRPDIVVLGSDRSSGLAEQAGKLCRALPATDLPSTAPTASLAEPSGTQGCSSSSSHWAAGAGGASRRRPAAPRADVLVADALNLPYQGACADAAMSIAVLHHISSVPRRVQLLAEMVRILRPGGRGLVTVWASEQEDPQKLAKWERINSSSQLQSMNASRLGGANDGRGKEVCNSSGDYFVPWHVPFHRADAASAVRLAEGGTDSSNVLASGQIDKQKGSVVFKRYYHLFDEGELEGLIHCLPGVEIVSSFYDKSNWCCIFRKVAKF